MNPKKPHGPAAKAPHVYRPQQDPRVLQTKKSLQAKAAAAKPEPVAKKVNAPPAAYRPNPTPRVLQAKKATDNKPGALRPTAPSNLLLRTPTAVLRTRTSVVQRAKTPYTAASVSADGGEPAPSFRSQNGQERLVIRDKGDSLRAIVNGKDVGYVTYNEETEEGQRRMRFGYIIITDPASQQKKLSAALLFALSMKALEQGINVMCVGHPDPGKRGYWEAMGIDYRGAQQKQHDINAAAEHNRGKEIPPVEETKPTEAIGPVRRMLEWSQESYRRYWNPE